LTGDGTGAHNSVMRETSTRAAALLWLAVFSGVLVWSAIRPHDVVTWFLEVLPALVLAATSQRFL